MRIYLVRHGETEYNVKGLYMSSDIPLSEIGFKQAQILANRFKNIKVEKVFSSPYERTKQTAKLIEEVVNVAVEYDDDLKEIVRPSEFIGKHLTDPQVANVKKILKENTNNPDFHYSDEENFFDLVKRAKRIIQKIKDLSYEDILLITHEGFMKVIIATLMFGEELNSEMFDKLYFFFSIKNTGITVLEKRPDEWKLITWNDHAHLG
ncbi:histidine phosphatase family protein [Candidatus Daviesbacteria bacterium]|nr:histidine phosphatase family protein [Candidatus Daviesbacteria bacterium]